MFSEYLQIPSCLQRGDRETESSWTLYEASRARKNRSIKERFRYYLSVL